MTSGHLIHRGPNGGNGRLPRQGAQPVLDSPWVGVDFDRDSMCRARDEYLLDIHIVAGRRLLVRDLSVRSAFPARGG